MIGLAICALSFAYTYFISRRSVFGGLFAVLTVGYFYGIIRANFPSTITYFAFDAAVAGFYLTLPWHRLGGAAGGLRSRQLVVWLALLIGWPTLLLLVPVQDHLVQLVGLRSHVLLLPFVLIGARLSRFDLDRLALALAGLNLIVFVIALLELTLGVSVFYPRNPVTELIYLSNDASGGLTRALRLPGTFVNAAAYGATMTMTLPFLVGAWVQPAAARWHRWLLGLAVFASVLAVFLAASRLPMLILGVIVLVSMFSAQLGTTVRVGWAFLLVASGWIVANNERLIYRLTTLSWESALERFSGSVNMGLVEMLFEYPLGNGLGAGGTNMPFFLQTLLRNPIMHESQYAVLLLEMGLPGLLLWLGFIGWVLTRPRGAGPTDRWALGHRLLWWTCAAHFGSGLIGIGFLTSVPFSVLLLIGVGWMVGHAYDRPENRQVPATAGHPSARTRVALRPLPAAPARPGRA